MLDYRFEDTEVSRWNGLTAVKTGENWGFIDKSGKLVIPGQYKITAFGLDIFDPSGNEFIAGVVRVKFNKNWGFIDTAENLIRIWNDNAELFNN